MIEDIKHKIWTKFKSLIILLFICIAVFAVLQFVSWNYIAKPNEFGDTAGWINGIFSAMAFAGVIYAIFMQRDELELQRDELAETRKELEGQKEEFKTQNETLKRQRFENTFFNMLQLQQQITNKITYTYWISSLNEDASPINRLPFYKTKSITITGREVFRITFEDIKSETDTIAGMRSILTQNGLVGYEDNYMPTYFDHYFRHLYRIFKFVVESPLIDREEDRYEYASMVRAQLSRYELIWLYYNALSCYGREKFKPLIERFAILKNIREDMLVKDINMNISFDRKAFYHETNTNPSEV